MILLWTGLKGELEAARQAFTDVDMHGFVESRLDRRAESRTFADVDVHGFVESRVDRRAESRTFADVDVHGFVAVSYTHLTLPTIRCV